MSGQTTDYKIGIWCFSTKHAALRSNSKDWLTWNQNNVSGCSDLSTCRLWNPIKRVGLVQNGYHHHFIDIVTLFSPW